MIEQRSLPTPRRRARAVAAAATSLAVLCGAATGWAWKDAAAVHAASATPAVTAAAPVINRAPAGGSYADVVEQVMPAVVTVFVERRATASPAELSEPMLRRFFGQDFSAPEARPRRERGLGSGVVVTADGYILTNHHVVDGAEQIRVEFADKRVLTATVVGDDAPSDLAVLKVDARGLRTMGLADSDHVRVGDAVMAIGNPLGVGQTVTMGIVSAKGRTTGLEEGSFEDFLQTDAAINQGNSGGALVNTQGELVGINSQIMSPSGGNIGLGFAIPSNMVRGVMDQLIAQGHVRRARLGVIAQPVTADIAASLGLAEVRGALVSDVQPGSPAANAGIRQGDVIVAVQGHPVTDSNRLRNEVSSAAPGSPVAIDIVRDGKPLSISARLEELKAEVTDTAQPGKAQGRGRFGMTVQPLTPEIADALSLPDSSRGMVVVSVEPDGPAAASGLQAKDVIEKVNGQAITSGQDLTQALDRVADKPVLVLVRRGNTGLFLTLKADRNT